jgi:hypothetical protein
MPHFATLRDYSFKEDIDDVRGANLYGVNDEKLGKIDDVIFDHNEGTVRYAVVDTGGWLQHKRFLVPAERVHAYEKEPDDFQVDLLKEHIERFPRFDEKMLESEKDWTDYEERYREAWHAAPVQHRQGTDRNITPPPGEFAGDMGDIRSFSQVGEDPGNVTESDLTPQRIAGKFPSTAPGSSKITARPAGTASQAEDAARTSGVMPMGRWHRFEELLRRERDDIKSRCPTCCPGERKIA